MKPPKNIRVIIRWIDDEGIHHQATYSNKKTDYSIEAASILLQLMLGEITEEDLKP